MTIVEAGRKVIGKARKDRRSKDIDWLKTNRSPFPVTVPPVGKGAQHV